MTNGYFIGRHVSVFAVGKRYYGTVLEWDEWVVLELDEKITYVRLMDIEAVEIDKDKI